MIAAISGLDVSLALRARLADLYSAYDDTLNDGEPERWPSMFTETCVYKVLPRENYERGLPIAVMYCESRAMLTDRVVALRETALYAPRIVRRVTSGICVRAADGDGWRLTANFALFETLQNQPSTLFLCGRSYDKVVDDNGDLRFSERLCVYDSTIIPASLVYPI
jgi:3-phenylpropionate/cinnamic acid dioxygenase small subunit